MGTVTKRTYCKLCMVHCGLVAELDGERVIRVRGDFDHPLTRGYTCPKGRASGEAHHRPEAITRPLMRKDGALVPVSWDEALDDIAARLKAIVATHGPHSVALNFGSGMGLDSSGYAMQEALHRALGGGPRFSPLTIDGVAKVIAAGAVGGFPGLNPKTDYERTELLLYVGTNPMVSHAHNTGMFNPAQWIKAVTARGAVWTIDPVRTETARFSTRHLAPLPGRDHAILAFLVREVLEGGFAAPAQPVTGLDELRAAVSAYDREHAAGVAGVDPADLAELAATMHRSGKVVVETGTGVTMAASANATQWLAWALMILTGAMNRPGGTWFHPGMLAPFDAFPLPEFDPVTPGPPSRPDVRGVLGEWPCAVLPDEIAAGTVRALFNFGGRLLRTWPDTGALEAALGGLALNVMTEVVANETSAVSTHVLPTKDALERAEFSRWDTLGWNRALQYSEPLVAPMGERRSGWWVVAEIMRRAGLEVPPHVPADDREPGADEAMLASFFTPISACSFAELRSAGYVERPAEFPAAWVDEHVARIGGWRLAPPDLLAQWHALAAADAEALAAPLVLTPRRQRRKVNSALDFLGAEAEALLHPDEAAAYGVADGAMVRLSTASGSIDLVARHDPAVRRGTVSVPHGHGAANVNRLTARHAVDPLGGMAHYSGFAVKIEPLQ